MLDTLIRLGTIVDGTGRAPYQSDIGIKDGTIVAVGLIEEPARETINANGLVITPGFVDVHTHYDGQVTWDSLLMPSSLHGVTTVVMGNCGVGFAPVRERSREWLIKLMEGVEDIPGTVLSEGIRWQWETFPEYLDVLRERKYAIDIAAQIPHGPLRTYVMGARGSDHTVHPDDQEILAMAELVKEALRYGAIGFTTSRTVAHRSSDGTYTPSLSATPAELLAIARAMREVDRGIFEIVSDFVPLEAEFELIRSIAEVSGRPVSIALTQTPDQPEGWRRILDLIDQSRQQGLDIHAQVTARPVSVLMGLQNKTHFLMTSATYRNLMLLPLEEQMAQLQNPSVKVDVLSDLDLSLLPTPLLRDWKNIYRFGGDLPYLPDPNDSVASVAARNGDSPESVAYDWLIAGGGKHFLFYPVRNYVDGNDHVLREMIASPNTVVGLGDAGAHCGVLCDASMPTFLMTYWHQQNPNGFPLEFIVNQLTQRTASAWGFTDRGVIAQGKRADLNLINLAKLRLEMPVYERDLPANGGRLIQRAEGYVATLVNGITIMKNGMPTGELPGQLVAPD